MRKWVGRFFLAIGLTLLVAVPTWAGNVNFYSTTASSENSAVVTNRAAKAITLVAALNFDTLLLPLAI